PHCTSHQHPSLSAYASHHSLHSFPTRRSSDLAVAHRPPRPDLARAGQGDGVKGPALEVHDDADAVDVPDVAVLGVGWAVAELTPDRKSTRLNSSHQIISYAVFCLKKKISIQTM